MTMAIATGQRALDAIWEKVEENERLDFEDGLVLMESDDLLQLGELANAARRRRGGTGDVYFVQNLYLNQTNVCRVKCKFCAFAVTQKQADAYTHTPGEMVDDALAQRELSRFTEIHMVGGESPHVDFDYYVDIIRRLHEAMPDVHLKCFTASEIHHMTKLSGLSHEEVLVELKAAGLGSLPGGGAEVFADRVRRLIAPGKEHPDFWFHTHRTAHALGKPLRPAARQRAQPGGLELPQDLLVGQAGELRHVVDLARREALQVHVGHGLVKPADDVHVVVEVDVRVLAADHVDLGEA